jgi:hypothetical protein
MNLVKSVNIFCNKYQLARLPPKRTIIGDISGRAQVLAGVSRVIGCTRYVLP